MARRKSNKIKKKYAARVAAKARTHVLGGARNVKCQESLGLPDRLFEINRTRTQMTRWFFLMRGGLLEACGSRSGRKKEGQEIS